MPSPAAIESTPHNVPREFYCPLTFEIMKEPVMSRWGVNYEREAIVTWLKLYGHFCPVTEKPLTPSDLISNESLQVRTNTWCRLHQADKVDNNFDPSVCYCDESQGEDIVTCSEFPQKQETPNCGKLILSGCHGKRGRFGFLKRLGSGRIRKQILSSRCA